MKSRFISIFLIFAMVMSLTLPVSASLNTSPSKSIDEVLSEFNLKCYELTEEKDQEYNTFDSNTSNSDDVSRLRHETVNELLDLGYNAYEVTSSTYDTVEENLNTDLSSLGVQKDYSYIIVVGGTDGNTSSSRGAYDDSYPYQYGGITYRLRSVTITSDNSPEYRQTNQVDLLSSKTDAIFSNAINWSISAIASAYGVPWYIGTILSISGLTSVNFVSPKDTTANFYAGTSWVRTFRQVWDENYNTWVPGSCVEKVEQICYVHGLKYSTDLHRYDPYTSDLQINTFRSSNYNNPNWLNENAVIAFRAALPQIIDTVGRIDYKHGDKVVITHKCSFI